jgi:outer membrane protein TolC
MTLAAEPPPSAVEARKDTYPIDLPTALRLAGAQNLDVRIAEERLAEARANRESALQQFLPWVSPGAAYRRHDNLLQDTEGNIVDVHKQSYAPGATVAAQVDVGGATFKSLEARSLVSAAAHGLDAEREGAIVAAAQGYFDLARTRAAVGVARDALRISKEYAQQLRQAVAIGIAFKGDELRVGVQSQRNEIALRRALEQQPLASARLARTLHLDSTVELAPREEDLTPLSLVSPESPLDRLVEEAMRSRPEVRRETALLAAAREAKTGALYGPLVPSIGGQAFFGGLGGGRGGDAGNFGESEDYVATLGWRIGPGGIADLGRLHATEARLRGAELAAEKVRDEVTAQVVEARERLRSLADQLSTARDAVGAAEESFRLSRERREFGVGVVLETIQSEEELSRTRNDYVSTVADYNKAQYFLLRTLGGLVEPQALAEQARGPARPVQYAAKGDEHMERKSWLSLARPVACLILGGCFAGPPPQAVSWREGAPVLGPTTIPGVTDVGYLRVETDTDQKANGDATYYNVRRPYEIYSADGKLVRWVENQGARSGEEPESVPFPPGRYVIGSVYGTVYRRVQVEVRRDAVTPVSEATIAAAPAVFPK